MKKGCCTSSLCGAGQDCPWRKKKCLRITLSKCIICFTIFRDESADIGKLPVGRTCFFRLEIPAYKNEDTFREKLMYAIRFCTDIDADIENAVQQEDDH